MKNNAKKNDILTADKVSDFIDEHSDKIRKSLSKNVNINKYISQFTGEMRKNPKLLQCTKSSLVLSMISCAQLDLYMGSSLGQVYLIPYEKGRNSGVFECQVQIGYKGLIELGMRTGKVNAISAQVVYEKDFLEFEMGTRPFLKHIPASSSRGKMMAVYAVAYMSSGYYQFDIMFKDQIDELRAKFANKYSKPWQDNYDEMAKKTVIKKLFKYLPLSPDLSKAVTLDDYAETGIQNQVIDVDNIDEINLLDNIEKKDPLLDAASNADCLAKELQNVK